MKEFIEKGKARLQAVFELFYGNDAEEPRLGLETMTVDPHHVATK